MAIKKRHTAIPTNKGQRSTQPLPVGGHGHRIAGKVHQPPRLGQTCPNPNEICYNHHFKVIRVDFHICMKQPMKYPTAL